MKNLMKMLASDSIGDDDNEGAAPMSTDDGDADNAPDEGFSAAADEVFSAIESKDMESFTSALKTCIEMAK